MTKGSKWNVKFINFSLLSHLAVTFVVYRSLHLWYVLCLVWVTDH